MYAELGQPPRSVITGLVLFCLPRRVPGSFIIFTLLIALLVAVYVGAMLSFKREAPSDSLKVTDPARHGVVESSTLFPLSRTGVSLDLAVCQLHHTRAPCRPCVSAPKQPKSTERTAISPQTEGPLFF